MQSSPSLDIVTVAIAVATLLFGRDMAVYIGPYAAIVLGAMLGGVWSASRRQTSSNLATIGYLAFWVLVTLLFTVPATEAVVGYWGLKDSRPLFAPVALLIAGVGPDWPAVVLWFLKLRGYVVGRRPGAPPPNDQPPPTPPTGGAL